MGWFSANKDFLNTTNSNIHWVELVSIPQLEKTLNESGKTFLVFKHSTRCSISKMILHRFENELKLQGENSTCFFLDLLSHRDISDFIADISEVKHESPQLLIFQNGKCVYHSSHNAILASSVKQYI